MTELKLPEKFNNFLSDKNWRLFEYQVSFLSSLNDSSISRFLISSDTGTGKTITLFLPFLINVIKKKNCRIIYISPLKSILSDLYKNLKLLISELELNINIDKRTGDESSALKKKQIENPSNIILTTPESLALLITKRESDKIFRNTNYLAVDELNDIINNKRGDLLSLTISRILEYNKKIKLFSASTNIQNFRYLIDWLSFGEKTKTIKNKYYKKLKLDISLLKNTPDFGHSSDFAISKIYEIIKKKKNYNFCQYESSM